MDPFSIIAGTVGVVDVSMRIIDFLVHVKEASDKIQNEITTLSAEVSALSGVNKLVEVLFRSRHDQGSLVELDAPSKDLWEKMAVLLKQCKDAVDQLEMLLDEVVGKGGNQVAGKIDGLLKMMRKKKRDGDYMQIRQRLANLHSAIHIILGAINIHFHKDLAVDRLPEDLRRDNINLQSSIVKLRHELKESCDSAQLHDSLVCADAVAALICSNKHFYTPQNVSSYYTGRQKQLDELTSILGVSASRQRQTHQKRFVITGLGGSGKTQSCCKFAQDNRDHFWGIFWIDGSSPENAQHSFVKIAKIGGLEPNEDAAKSWLSSLDHQWLLLIDNADDEEMQLLRCFPSGERGVILITTQDPTKMRCEIEDKLGFQFEKLEEEELTSCWRRLPFRAHDQCSKDALQLLKIFSFLHRENIELDLLKTAAMNPPRRERDIQAKEADAAQKHSPAGPRDWQSRMKNWAVSIATQLERPGNILPEVLRDEDDVPFDQDRLRLALALLVKRGMVTLQDENNSYWMHPLVHEWVRKRPHTSTAEQAIWCRAAAMVLVQAVLLRAPRADTVRNDRMQRQIRLHVEHVLTQQEVIRQKIAEQAVLRRLLSCSYRNPNSQNLRLLNMSSLAWCTQYAQQYYGMHHPKTLEVMDTLGATCLVCSRFSEAKKLHENVIAQLNRLENYGPKKERILTAVDNLAKVKLRFFDNAEAVRLQREAYEGFEQLLGPAHQKTLEAKDNLAGIYGFLGADQLPLAHKMSEEVRRVRVRDLGREHPLTLKSMLTLAKIKTALDQFDEAEAIFLEGLPAAERNLGKSHLGTLTARIWLAHLYWRQGRYDEAAAIWEDVIDKRNFAQSKREDGEHGDRAQAMWFLVYCYEDQGKIDKALALCEQLHELLREFGGETLAQQHKLWKYVQEKMEELKRLNSRPADGAWTPPTAGAVPPRG